MSEQTPDVEPNDDDLPPVFHDPEADDAPETVEPAEHLEPDETPAEDPE